MLAVKELNKNFAMQQHNKVAEAFDEERDRKRERRRLTTLETGF